MPRVLDELHQDHINVDRLLRILASEFDKMSSMAAADYDVALDVVRYLTEYSDRYHHPREDLVYDRLLERVPQVSDDIKQVIKEHGDLGSHGSELREYLVAVESDAVITRERLREIAEAYIDQLRAHMFSEEDVFFPIAERHLTNADWEDIERALHVGPDPVFGDHPDAQQSHQLRALIQYVQQAFPSAGT